MLPTVLQMSRTVEAVGSGTPNVDEAAETSLISGLGNLSTSRVDHSATTSFGLCSEACAVSSALSILSVYLEGTTVQLNKVWPNPMRPLMSQDATVSKHTFLTLTSNDN